jgi:hypothetical protein
MISQALLFRQADISRELGLVLWAALREIETFFNLRPVRTDFRRTYLSEFVPEQLRSEIGLEWHQALERSGTTDFWRRVRGQYARTYDQAKLIDGVRRLLAPTGMTEFCFVICDQLLTPPPDLRYIISAGDKHGAVVSIPPTDPVYWGNRSRDRIHIIKHRVRTNSITSVGEMVFGWHRCDNPECFMFGAIDSVNCLDTMIHLGEEHNEPSLTGRGFQVRSSDPTVPQPIELHPAPLPAASDRDRRRR